MKRAAIFVVTVVLLAVTLPVFAVQFADVPADHWAYAAVQDLSDRGIVFGYPDGTFSGKRALTRYEFAEALSRAIPVIAKSAGGAGAPGAAGPKGEVGPTGPQGPSGVTAEQLANIQTLVDEFRDELGAQGVDIQALKKYVAALDARMKAVEAEQARVKISAEMLGAFQGTISNSGHGLDRDSRIFFGDTNPLVGNDFFNDLQLKINGRVSNTACVSVLIDAGNYLPVALGTSPFFSPGRSYMSPLSEDFTLFHLYLEAVVGLGPLGSAQATIGRFPFQLTPLTLKFVAPDSYLYLSTLQNGDYVLDGGNVAFKLGKANVTAFAADRVASFGFDQPFLQLNRGLLIDQLAGARAVLGLSKNGNLGLTYYQAGPASSNGIGQMRVYGADAKINIGNLGINGEWAKTDPSDFMNAHVMPNFLELKTGNEAWNANLAYKIGKLNIGGGYTEVGANYAAPGDWSRLGKAVNLQNVKGEAANISYILSPKLTFCGDASFFEPKDQDFVLARSATDEGLRFASANIDRITGWKAGVKYALTAANTVDLGMEEVQYKSNTAGTAKEAYYNIGFGHSFSSNAGFKVLYQIISNKVGAGGFDFYGDGPNRGGITTAQFNVKF